MPMYVVQGEDSFGLHHSITVDAKDPQAAANQAKRFRVTSVKETSRTRELLTGLIVMAIVVAVGWAYWDRDNRARHSQPPVQREAARQP